MASLFDSSDDEPQKPIPPPSLLEGWAPPPGLATSSAGSVGVLGEWQPPQNPWLNPQQQSVGSVGADGSNTLPSSEAPPRVAQPPQRAVKAVPPPFIAPFRRDLPEPPQNAGLPSVVPQQHPAEPALPQPLPQQPPQHQYQPFHQVAASFQQLQPTLPQAPSNGGGWNTNPVAQGYSAQTMSAEPIQAVAAPAQAPMQVPPAAASSSKPLLPPVPEPPKQKLLQGMPPTQKEVPSPALQRPGDIDTYAEGTKAWESFIELKKVSEDSAQRISAGYANVTQLQLTHEREAAAYRDATQRLIDQQRQAITTLKEECKEAANKVESLSAVLSRKAEALLTLEQRVYELTVELTEARQRVTHVEDRATLAESGRQIAEIKQNELQRALDHSCDMIKSLRQLLSDAQNDKQESLQRQYDAFEVNRKAVIDFYNEREKDLVHEFNDTVKVMQSAMEEKMKEREEHLSKYWREMVANIEERYTSLAKEVDVAKETHEKEFNARVARMEQDKVRWYDQYRSEMATLEQRHKEREDHVLVDIARRERELAEREQRLRVQRAQEEQETKVALLAKEAELKSYYEKIVEDLRVSHEKDREKQLGAFREQLQQLSNQHLANERELERLHRDKEREMAQRYRVAGYEVDDRKGQVDLRDVTMTAQSSLLSKFDSIEARQRERAEKTRMALKESTEAPAGGASAA